MKERETGRGPTGALSRKANGAGLIEGLLHRQIGPAFTGNRREEPDDLRIHGAPFGSRQGLDLRIDRIGNVSNVQSRHEENASADWPRSASIMFAQRKQAE